MSYASLPLALQKNTTEPRQLTATQLSILRLAPCLSLESAQPSALKSFICEMGTLPSSYCEEQSIQHTTNTHLQTNSLPPSISVGLAVQGNGDG